MTQQPPDLVIEPQTRRYTLSVPGTRGLLRHDKRTRFRYPGLLHPITHRKYEFHQRSTAHGGSIRMLSDAEIEEWYARVAAIQQGVHRENPIGPLPEKPR